jgi:hypothetical protein
MQWVLAAICPAKYHGTLERMSHGTLEREDSFYHSVGFCFIIWASSKKLVGAQLCNCQILYSSLIVVIPKQKGLQ